MEKQRWEKSQKRKEEERRSEKRNSQKREDPGAREGTKVAKHRCFPMFCGSGGSKGTVGSLKRWVRSHLAKREIRNCTPLGRKADLARLWGSDRFWTMRSTKCARRLQRELDCTKKDRKKLTGPDHFWTLGRQNVHEIVARARFHQKNRKKLTLDAEVDKMHAIVIK